VANIIRTSLGPRGCSRRCLRKPYLIYPLQVLIKSSSHLMEKLPSQMTVRLFWVRWRWSIRSRSSSYNSREVRTTRLAMVQQVSSVRLVLRRLRGLLLKCILYTSSCWGSARTKRSPPGSRHSPHPNCRRLRPGVRDRGEQSREHSRHDRVQQDSYRKSTQNCHDQSR